MAALPWIAAMPRPSPALAIGRGSPLCPATTENSTSEVVMIKRPNLELAHWRCPGAVDLGGGDTGVIGGPDRDN